MSGPASQSDPFPQSAGCVAINGCFLSMTVGTKRVIVVSGVPIAQYAVGDRMAEAHNPHSQPQPTSPKLAKNSASQSWR
ncbi:MAG: hypothetical protein AAB074_22420 [Planctomycetota bacterium]